MRRRRGGAADHVDGAARWHRRAGGFGRRPRCRRLRPLARGRAAAARPGQLGGGEPLVTGATEAVNSFGDPGWAGPCPPPGDGPHTYQFTLHVLDQATRAPRRIADRRPARGRRRGDSEQRHVHRHVRARLTAMSLPPPTGLPQPPPVERTVCYRHPDREAGRRCTRCGRPACTECLVRADIGSQCVECAKRGRPPTATRARDWSARQPILVTYALMAINARRVRVDGRQRTPRT